MGMYGADGPAIRAFIEALVEFSGVYLSEADLGSMEHDPKQVILADPKVRKDLRQKFYDHPWLEAERSHRLEVEMALDGLAPTDEQIEHDAYVFDRDRILRENDVRVRTGEKPLQLPDPPSLATRKASAKTKATSSKQAKADAKGRKKLPAAAVTGREDVLAYGHTLKADVSQAELAERHRRGILTPKESPVEEVLTPPRYADDTTLTPKSFDEEKRLHEARVKAQYTVDKEQKELATKRESASKKAASGKPPKKGARKAARRPTAKKLAARKQATKKVAPKKPAAKKSTPASRAGKPLEGPRGLTPISGMDPKSDAGKVAKRGGAKEAKKSTKQSATGKLTRGTR